MTISRHLSLAFIVVGAGVSLVSLGALAWLLSTAASRDGSPTPTLYAVQRLKSHLNVAVQESFAHMVSGLDPERGEFEAALARADGVLDELADFPRFHPNVQAPERALLDRIRTGREGLETTAMFLFAGLGADETADGAMIVAYDDVVDSTNAALDALLATERTLVDEAEAAAHRAIIFATIVLAGVTLVAIAGAFVGGRVLGRRITRPMLGLEQAALRLAEGDLDPVEESGPREIVVLARAFNRMAADVSNARSSLESAVEERTAELRQTNDALRESEQRYQDLYDNAPDIYWSVDLDSGRIIDFNRRASEVLGYAPDELRRKPIVELYDSSCRDEAMAAREQLIATGQVSVPHFIVRRKSGEALHVSLSATAVRDENGHTVRSRSILHDLTLQRQAQERLRESEERYRSLVENAPLCIHELDCEGRFLSINPSGILMLGATGRHEVLGRPCLDIVGEADRLRIRSLFADALQGHPSEFEFDGSADAGPSPSRYKSCFIPMLDADGAVFKVMGLTEDVTDRRDAEEHRQLMISELDHRVKNNLAAVLALATQSLETAESLEGFGHSFVGRIHAMARSHEALARANWSAIDISDAVDSALRPFLFDGAPRCTTGGQPARLAPEVASPLGLVLHELATNAAKHGALSAPSGHVEVKWQAQGAHLTDLTWIESNGPRVTSPSKEGFGLQLLRGLVEHEIGGGLEVEFLESGLSCRIVFPEPGSTPEA